MHQCHVRRMDGSGRLRAPRALSPAEDYVSQTGRVFNVPVNPGDLPPPGIPHKTPQQAAHRLKTYERNLVLWQCYSHTEKALKKQVQDAVEEVYLRAITDMYGGFAGISLCRMYGHLFEHYGVVNEEEVEENNVRMMAPYDPSTPIINMFDQLERGRNFAALGHEIIASTSLVSKRDHLVGSDGSLQ